MESIMVYRLPDLRADEANFADAAMAVRFLGWSLHPHEKLPLRVARRQELLKLNLIQAASQSENDSESKLPTPP
jgi:hypothetical protein